MQIIFIAGRILFGGFFLLSGINHFKNRGMLAGYAASKGVPSPALAVSLSGILLLLGGAGILFGISVQFSLALLALFLVPVSFIMHPFWKEEGDARMADMTQFLKNMALLGAVLMIYALSGGWVQGLVF